jgi:hypothetical protein
MKGILQKVYGSKIKGDKTENSSMRLKTLGEKGKSFNYKHRLWEKNSCVIGHFPMSKYSMLRRDGWKFLTWVRDPVDRIVSIYSQRRNMKFMRHMPDFMDLDVFQFSERINNVYKLYLDKIDILDFVGFTEAYNESLLKLGKFLGHKVNLNYKRKNITDNKITITEEEREILKSTMDSEYEIYNYLREKFG